MTTAKKYAPGDRETQAGTAPEFRNGVQMRHCMSEEILSPKLVEAYLRRSGWTEPQPRSATFATFCKGVAWIDVPVCAEHFAYPRRFRELITKLSRLESRPVAVILNEIAAVSLRTIEDKD